MPTAATNVQNPVCPACQSKAVVKKGRRRNRLHAVALYQCGKCLHRFTGEAGKNKTYPLRTILEAITTYNTGYSLTETQRILRRRLHRRWDAPMRRPSGTC